MIQPPATTYFVRGLLLRLLAGVYLVAFLSFWVQGEGLIGPRGILPVGEFLEAARGRLGDAAYWRLPTVFWLSGSDTAIHLVSGAGVVLSVLAIGGFLPLLCFVLLWALYLSVLYGGQDFLSFQWDILLLEAGVLAWFLAPARLRAGIADRRPPPTIGMALMRLLVWKLMFLSGATKLLSFDPTWWKLTALDVHYYTQPLPWWTSWFMNRLPATVDKACVAITLAIEIAVPFLIFCGRRARLVAFVLLVALQLAIAWTGNYGFFNLLTIVLCVALLDDDQVERFLPMLSERRLGSPRARDLGEVMRRGWVVGTLRVAAAAMVVAASLLVTVRELDRTLPPGERGGKVGDWIRSAGGTLLPRGQPLLEILAPFHSVNGYGLFRSMTTSRPEIVIEASADGVGWKEIGFRYKPGDISRRPRLVAPHQPRLDWQMWFAALDPQGAGWLPRLLRRLLEGEPAVWELLDAPEWKDSPPRYVQLRYYEYEFTDAAEREKTGAWWRRRSLGVLTQRLSLENLEKR